MVNSYTGNKKQAPHDPGLFGITFALVLFPPTCHSVRHCVDPAASCADDSDSGLSGSGEPASGIIS